MMSFGETPAAEHTEQQYLGKIVHARMTFGSNTLMASDAPSQYYEPMKSLSVIVDTPEEAERIYNAFAKGAEIKMPMRETFWAVRYGMLTDRFGTPWMINCEKKQ